jgi:hypothetical protein
MTKGKRRKPKDHNVYPPGWNYQRAKAIADYYDARKDLPVLDSVETSEASAGLVWMEVPQDLVSDVRKLIARRRKSA